ISVSRAPDYLMSRDWPDCVLQFEIQDIEIFRETPGDVAFGPVVIALQTDAGAVGERAAPTRQQVRSGDLGSARRRLIELPAVRVTLQGKTIASAIPVGTEACLPLLP